MDGTGLKPVALTMQQNNLVQSRTGYRKPDRPAPAESNLPATSVCAPASAKFWALPKKSAGDDGLPRQESRAAHVRGVPEYLALIT